MKGPKPISPPKPSLIQTTPPPTKPTPPPTKPTPPPTKSTPPPTKPTPPPTKPTPPPTTTKVPVPKRIMEGVKKGAGKVKGAMVDTKKKIDPYIERERVRPFMQTPKTVLSIGTSVAIIGGIGYGVYLIGTGNAMKSLRDSFAGDSLMYNLMDTLIKYKWVIVAILIILGLFLVWKVAKTAGVRIEQIGVV